MPLTKARSVVLDIVDVSKSLKDNTIDAGIRDYVDEQIIDVSADLNAVASSVTTLTSTVNTINASYFPKNGGTLTGAITINASSGEGIRLNKSYPILQLNNTDNRFTTNTPNTIISSKQDVPVWELCLGNGSPFTSGDSLNIGADFVISTYTDTGVFQDSPIFIPRDKSGAAFINRELYIRDAGGVQHEARLVLATHRSGTGSSNRVIIGARLTAGDTWYKPLWDITLGDSYNGSGTNSSANFSISRYGDNGSLINSPLSINRSSGVVTVPNGISTYGHVMVQGLGMSVEEPSVSSQGGYAELTNGLILQWGVKHVPADGRAYVTLPVAFPNYIMNLQATIEGDTHDLATDALVSAKIINNSQIRLTNGYRWSLVTIWWMALGR